MSCAACERDDGNYSMDKRCCRVRYLLKEPRVEVRRAWLERWEKKLGGKEAEAIRAAFAEAWEKKKTERKVGNGNTN